MRYCERCGAAFRYQKTCPRDRTPLTAGVFDPLVGRVLGERYRVLERIGAGAMGQVYRAAHARIACTFAVKVLWGDLAYDPNVAPRFTLEAEVASVFASRFIVRVVDFAHDAESLPYLVMEHLDGPSLDSLITREGTILPMRAARIAERIARGLSHAHSRGIVHRDLKPDNVIVVDEDDERDIPKILDFGVARIVDAQRLTVGGAAVGTPLYMAPEQLAGADVDARTDLYALGCVLFEMLTGKPPFDAPSLEELRKKHTFEAPASLRRELENRGAPAALDEVMQRLLAKNPAHRFQSAREVATTLDRILSESDRPSSAPASIAPSRSNITEATALGAIYEAIDRGAPLYNAGDHQGCYELYRGVAERIVSTPSTAVAVAARLTAAIQRAQRAPNPTTAAWELRYAFDDLLAPKPIRLSGAFLPDELATFGAIVARREAEGAIDLLGDVEIAFAELLSLRLIGDVERPTAASTLEAAARTARAKGGGRAALAVIEPVLVSLRNAGAGSGPMSRPSPSGNAALAATSSAFVGAPEEVLEAIVQAIRVGAPAYNEGRVELCARIYRDTAQGLRDRLVATGAAPAIAGHLEAALRAAANRNPPEAAWIFRHAFDAILGA
ncbi:MAG: serine/threonine-protein kinase [Polyangiaceae bacterium]